MKKILLSTIVLFCFSLSIILFQISCKKTAEAQGTAPTTIEIPQQNKIIFIKNFFDGSRSSSEIWTSDYNGSNRKKINIQLPTGASLRDEQPSLSPDKKTMFFTTSVQGKSSIFSCNLDGTNVKLIIENDVNPASDGPTNAVAY